MNTYTASIELFTDAVSTLESQLREIRCQLKHFTGPDNQILTARVIEIRHELYKRQHDASTKVMSYKAALDLLHTLAANEQEATDQEYKD